MPIQHRRVFGTTEDEAGAGEEPGVKRKSHRDAVRRTREEIKRAVDDMRNLLEELLPNQIEVCPWQRGDED